MYLAPINYDRFFERVFRDIKIAKQFLEDLLNINIDTLKKFSICRVKIKLRTMQPLSNLISVAKSMVNISSLICNNGTNKML